jgi:hypothetical protein
MCTLSTDKIRVSLTQKDTNDVSLCFGLLGMTNGSNFSLCTCHYVPYFIELAAVCISQISNASLYTSAAVSCTQGNGLALVSPDKQ